MCTWISKNSEKYFEAFVKAGRFSFHVEVHRDPTTYLSQLKSMGVEAGLSLDPDAPADMVLPYLEHADLLLVMSALSGVWRAVVH